MMFVATIAPCFAANAKYGVDLGGKPIDDLAGPESHVVVLFFAASDCPISNRYVPEIARLTDEFRGRGVRVWWVYPNASDTADVVNAHDREFSIHGAAILDTNQDLVKLAHVGVTPEAAVFVVESSGLREVYHGRIDDRYLSIGQERPQAQHHDLEAAIGAALTLQSAPPPGGPPVGCSIVFQQK
jgi:hypothetical protein